MTHGQLRAQAVALPGATRPKLWGSVAVLVVGQQPPRQRRGSADDFGLVERSRAAQLATAARQWQRVALATLLASRAAMAEWAPRCDRVVRLDDSGKPEREGLLVVPLGCDVVLQLSPSRKVDPVSVEQSRMTGPPQDSPRPAPDATARLSGSLQAAAAVVVSGPARAAALGTACPQTTIRLWTNAPLDPDTPFSRSRFRPVRGTDESHRDGDWVARIPVLLPGSLEFFIEFQPMRDGTLTTEPAHKAAPHADSPFGDAAWRKLHGRAVENVALSSPHAPSAAARRGPMVRLLVHPRLGAWVDPEAGSDGVATPPGEPVTPGSDASPPSGERRLHASILRGAHCGPCDAAAAEAEAGPVFRHIPLDGLMLQTNLTRCLGPLAEWDEQLAETVAAGFNMVHLTPPQQLGASGSAYSVFDQLTLADSLWAGGAAPPDRDAAMLAALQRLERRHGLQFMADLVLNHTASDSAFLADQPECAFTLRNSPWLRPAAALDGAIARVSASAASREGGWPIACESDVAGVLARLRDGDKGLRCLRLWEYYVAAPAPQLAALAAWAAGAEWRRKAGVSAAATAPAPATSIEEATGERAPDEADAAPTLAALAAASAGSAEKPIRVATLGAGDAWTSAECVRAAGRIAAAAARAGPVARPLSAASASAVARDLMAAEPPREGWKCAEGPGSDSRLASAGAWNAGTGARFPVRIAPAALAAALDGAADDTGGPILWQLVGRVAAGSPDGGMAEARACARALQAVGAAVDAVNAPLYDRYDGDVAAALRGVESAAKQLWLSERRGRCSLSAEHPFVWAYFERAGPHAVACNGFVWGGDPKIDFTLPTDAAHAYADLAFRLADQPCVDDAPAGGGQCASAE
ncbi:AGL, partial [Symbiodinium sp. KB8]